MDNPEKLATGHTRYKTKTNKTKNTTQYVLDTTTGKQAQLTQILLHRQSTLSFPNVQWHVRIIVYNLPNVDHSGDGEFK